MSSLTNERDDCNINKTIFIELNETNEDLPKNIIIEDIETQNIKKQIKKANRQNIIAIVLTILGFFLWLPWLINACLYMRSSNKVAKVLSIVSLVLFILAFLIFIPFLGLAIAIAVSPRGDGDHER